jgi:hypothetical protein
MLASFGISGIMAGPRAGFRQPVGQANSNSVCVPAEHGHQRCQSLVAWPARPAMKGMTSAPME